MENAEKTAGTWHTRVEQQFRTPPSVPINHNIADKVEEINVLAIVNADPTIPLRQIEDQIAVNRETARRILKKYKLIL